MFNRYFQDELLYLRELGREFAAAYPALAPMLADRGGDPDVERLLEGVAFLTGRIRQKIDDELPEVIHGIASLLFPHLIRPLPATTIVEVTPLHSVLRERVVVPPGAEFGSIPVDGTQCRFQSVWPLELVPWAIEDVRLELLPRGRQQLRITFRAFSGKIGEIAPERTRLHLAGDIRSQLALLMWLHQHLEDVVLINETTVSGTREISLGKKALTHAGFEEDEALLPFGRMTFPGYRLLEEYYVLPQKFAFVDVKGLARAQELDKESTTFVLALRFDQPFKDAPASMRDSVKLHCVPAVNVFETSAEPIRLEAGRERFLVRPAGLRPGHAEVYAIERLETIPVGTTKRIIIPSFYDFSHAENATDSTRTFYSSHLMPSVVSDGIDLFVSFGTPEDAGTLPDADVVSVDLLATNGRLANALRAGEVSVPTPTSPAMATFKNLLAVTPYVPPPTGRELQWRVVAHASMGLRSLAELEVLRAVLDVYNLQALVDRQAARANELRVAALKDVRMTPSERLYRGALVRGIAVDVDVDESGFVGDGDLYLFSGILDQLFASYVSLNSFSKTTVHGVTSNLKFAWPPRTGNQTLL